MRQTVLDLGSRRLTQEKERSWTRVDDSYLVGSRLHGDDGIKGDQHDHDSQPGQNRRAEVL